VGALCGCLRRVRGAAVAGGADPIFLVYGLYYGLSESPEKALIADLVPAERRGWRSALQRRAGFRQPARQRRLRSGVDRGRRQRRVSARAVLALAAAATLALIGAPRSR